MTAGVGVATSVALLAACAAEDAGGEASTDASASAEASPTPHETTAAEIEEAESLLESVAVSGDAGSKPTVEFAAPLDLPVSATRVVLDGTGEETTTEDTLQIQYLMVGGADAAEIETSWETGAQTVPLDSESGVSILIDALIGRKVGDRVLIGLAAVDGFASNGQELSTAAPFGPEDTLVYVIDIVGIVPETAQGEAVTDVPADLPTVQTEGDSVTGLTVPQGGTEPTSLVVQPLIQGSGATVASTDTVTVHYWGVLWSDGSTFDESWTGGEPISFALDQVIPGWTQGLTGQQVGSRVLLVIPSELGYQEEEQTGIPAGSTLVFVVDILATTPLAG